MAIHKPNLRKQLQRDKPKKLKANEEQDFPEINLEEQYGKAEGWINKNTGLVMGATLGIILLLGAYFWFSKVFVPGQEATATEEMYLAQQKFSADDFAAALNGEEGSFPGFLELTEGSGFAKTTNLANYYAGVSYLNLGEFQNAIDYLGKFKASDPILYGMAQGAMGDAYMELGDNANGVKYYKSAASATNSDFTGPMWLMKAGKAMERNGDAAGARSMYQQIQSKYPKSNEARSVDKYIRRAS